MNNSVVLSPYLTVKLYYLNELTSELTVQNVRNFIIRNRMKTAIHSVKNTVEFLFKEFFEKKSIKLKYNIYSYKKLVFTVQNVQIIIITLYNSIVVQ